MVCDLNLQKSQNVTSMISYLSHRSTIFNMGKDYTGHGYQKARVTRGHFGDWLSHYI